MKVLYVSGGDDYAAWGFERKEFNYKEIWEKARKLKNNIWIYSDVEDAFEVQALEFGEVDKEFINFVQNKIQDYDDSKHTNFYIIKE